MAHGSAGTVRRGTLWTSVAVTAVAAGTAGAWAATAAQPDQPPFSVTRVEASHVFDLANLDQLTAAGDHVFVGRVGPQVSAVRLGVAPETQFQVDVVRRIKGQLPASVLVNQQGGYDGFSNRLVLMENDEMLETGRSYLFVTRVNPQYGWHTLVPGTGKVRLDPRQGAAGEARVLSYQRAVERTRGRTLGEVMSGRVN